MFRNTYESVTIRELQGNLMPQGKSEEIYGPNLCRKLIKRNEGVKLMPENKVKVVQDKLRSCALHKFLVLT